MKFFNKKFKLNSPIQIFKLIGFVLLIGVALIFVINFVLSPLVSVLEQSTGMNLGMPSSSSNKSAYDMDEAMVSREMYAGEMGGGADGMVMPGRPSIAPSPMPPSEPGVVSGDDAEDYELTSYDVTVETKDLDATCQSFLDLKAKDYVIFENANRYDQGCYYTFKVQVDKAAEVLALIEEMDPKNFSENTYTIKQNIEYFETESQILKKKLESIETTLQEAITAYDEISTIATRGQDTESLAKIIDSKIGLIERLTQQRIETNERLARIAKSQSDQMDRLAYTFFNVSVVEMKYLDLKAIKESWQAALKTFVNDINRTAQDMTLQLLVFILLALQYALYLGVLVLVAKYGWQFGKYVWKK